MNTIPLNGHAQRVLAAVRGIKAFHDAAVLASTLCWCQRPRSWRTHWSGCSKEDDGVRVRCGHATTGPRPPPTPWRVPAPAGSATLARRARACTEGRAGWACIDAQDGRAATTPAPGTVEVAAEVKASVLIALHQEMHDVSRSLLRTGDRRRAAGQWLKARQAHNATLLAPVSQAAVPGGASGHEFTCAGGWLEPAQQAQAVQFGASIGQGM